MIAFLTYLIMSLFCEANTASIDSKNHNVSIEICASNNSLGFAIHAIIQNNTKDTINFSVLGEFGNGIYILHPDGKVSMSLAALDLPSDFEYKPEYSVNAGDSMILKALVTDDAPSFLYPLLRRIEETQELGQYEIWFDLINWVDFRGNKFDKYTSNRIVFYVGADGKKTFINDPEAIQSFKEIGVEMGNSSEEVRVERSAEGNYELVEIAHSNRFKNTVFSQFKNHSLIGWIALAMIATGIAYCFWRRISKRSANASMR